MSSEAISTLRWQPAVRHSLGSLILFKEAY